MAKDFSNSVWHGIPRKEIPWNPSVIQSECIGCELCYITCGRDVFSIVFDTHNKRKAIVANPLNCMVGCSTCSVVCPTDAINFPLKDVVWNAEKGHRIFRTVHQEAAKKREKQQEIKKEEEEIITHKKIMITGEFGEKRFLMQLKEFLNNKPFDIVDLNFKLPSLNNMYKGAPAVMEFMLTSTKQEKVDVILPQLKKLVTKNKLIFVE